MQQLRQFFAYDHWANSEALASLRRASDPPNPALKRFAHIIAAEFLWYARLSGTQAVMAVWPEPKIEAFSGQLDALRATWVKYLDELTAAKLKSIISYKNSKGEQFDSCIEDILMHMLFHSTYHRGQIASDLRAAGAEPAYTDYIHGVRSGALKKDK